MSDIKTDLEKIRATQRNFDLDVMTEQDERIMPTNGSQYDGRPQGTADESSPLEAALEAVDFASSEPFQNLLDIVKGRIAEWSAASERLDKPQDYRSSNHVMAIAAKRILEDFANLVAEYRQRVRGASKDERQLLGPEANKLIHDLLSEPEEVIEESFAGPSARDSAETEAIAKRKFIESTGRASLPHLEQTLASLNMGVIPGPDTDED
jgi:hypothetical protein